MREETLAKGVHYLNFGCPAPTVNRHGGGAMLLDDPQHIGRIVSAVRRAVPAGIPVSAKMRLGVRDPGKALECAQALAAGGIAALVVHARTRDEGYKPSAHWEWVARIRAAVGVPVVANGEVWTADDYARCRSISGCADVMIGRGAVADPFLARRIRVTRTGGAATPAATSARAADWLELLPALGEFWHQVQARVEPRHAPGRLKLWLNALRGTFVEAEALYWTVRALRDIDETDRALEHAGVPPDCGQLPPGRLIAPMHANSRVPTSAQTGIHEQLATLLDRHCASSFRKPYTDYNRAAFETSLERRERVAPGAPLILDAGCGVGESSIALAQAFPDHYVIGIDQSESRLSRNGKGQPGSPALPSNLDLVRADLVDYWRLLGDADIRLARHYLLYPNPWPKIGHLARRWHGHPVFPALLKLGGVLECRSNWRIYIDELCFALARLTQDEAFREPYAPEDVLTPFERKYLASGHRLYRVVVTL